MNWKLAPIVGLALAAAALVLTGVGIEFSIGGGDARGAPVEGSGAPEFVVSPTVCGISGGRLAFRASGFVPGSTVTISNPTGHYPERPIVPAQEFVAGPAPYGEIESSIKLPNYFPAHSRQWTPIVLNASGQAIDGQDPGESFDAVLLATASVCHELKSKNPK
jgi:hypothetical protein